MKKRSLRLCLLVAVLALTVGPVSPSPASAATERQSYLVRFKDGVDAYREAAGLARRSPLRRVFERVFSGAQVELTEAEAARLRSDPRVAAVEPDQIVSVTATQTNPTWGLDRIDQRSLPLSGTYSYPEDGGANVTAYVVDSGIRADHVDFTGRLAPGMTVINDGRGTDDCYWHGTHVAGTVGGSRYGVAKAVTLVPVRVFDCAGKSSFSGILAALEWIIGNHIPGTAAVVNMSLGGPKSSIFDSATNRVIAAGVTVVAAAGNNAGDACSNSPAGAPGVITVGAIDSTDTVAGFSNQGRCVDLFAPGVDIRSSSNTSSTAAAANGGTSMAAPHVAGAVAVLLGQQPSLTPSEVATAITSSATSAAIKNRKLFTTDLVLYSPAPRPANDDFARATPFALDDTSPLRGPSVGATNEGAEPVHAGSAATSSVWWSFTPPTDGTISLSTVGSTFDTVLGLYTGNSVAALTEVAANDDVSGNPWSELTAAIAGGTTYHLAVDGRGGDSGDIVVGFTFTPAVVPVPGAPTITEVAAGNASATVKWTPPNGGGSGITAYVVRAYAGPTLIQTASAGPGTTTVVGGLQNGTTYTFTVAATTTGGAGAESAASEPVTPRTVPGAPTDVQATGSDSGAVITWTPPASDGGAPIESYRVTVFAGSTPLRTETFLPSTTAVIGNLANGASYSFSVVATNAAGAGPVSAPSPAVTATEPTPEAPPPIPAQPAVNHSPVAVPDAYQATAGVTVSVPGAQGVLANDQDPDGDVLTAAIIAGPGHGTVKMDSLGGFTYTPDRGWIGADSVGYEARDGLGGVSSATVTLHTSADTTSVGGYWMLSAGGRVYTFGNARPFGDGSSGATDLEPTPGGDGYWILNADGAVGNFGAARDLGGSPALRTGEKAASLSVTPSGNGYWIFTSAGRVFAYGDAPHHGDMSGTALNGAVLDSVATPSGRGYWMVASDGGIFSFGDAKFFGSMGHVRLNQPVISMAPDPDGTGYWLVAADGGIFAFDASFHGSMGSVRLNKPVSGMVPGSAGYLMVAEDGGIFAFGNVPFHGSLGATPPPRPIVAVALAH